jgi:hypothetical protein
MKNLNFHKGSTILLIVCAVGVLICLTVGGLTGNLIGETPKLGEGMAKATTIFIGTVSLVAVPVNILSFKTFKP